MRVKDTRIHVLESRHHCNRIAKQTILSYLFVLGQVKLRQEVLHTALTSFMLMDEDWELRLFGSMTGRFNLVRLSSSDRLHDLRLAACSCWNAVFCCWSLSLSFFCLRSILSISILSLRSSCKANYKLEFCRIIYDTFISERKIISTFSSFSQNINHQIINRTFSNHFKLSKYKKEVWEILALVDRVFSTTPWKPVFLTD